jgi:hypothetical protein
MPIVSSTYTVGHAQRDGSRRVVERHTWDDGSVTELEYGPVPDTVDYQAIANARAAQLEAQAAEQEFQGVIGGA